MAFTYETQGNNTFLVYRIGEEDQIDTMALGMVQNNKIPGLLPVLYTQMNSDRYLKYNVTAKLTLERFFSGVVNKHRLLGVFSSIASVLAVLDEYMINTDSLLLNVSDIYADVSTCRAEVICLPLLNQKAEGTDVLLFFKNIMFSTQFDQTENCDYVARIINYLNGTPMFIAEDFVRLLRELQEPSSNVTSSGAAMQQPVIQPVSDKKMPDAGKNRQEDRPVFPKTGVERPREESKPEGAGLQQSGGPRFEIPGMQAVPPKAPVPEPVRAVNSQPAAPQPQQSGEQKQMSIFYLLQHYNKENAAAYKAQREGQKKEGKPAPTGKKDMAPNQAFAIPGQTPSIPSQSAPAAQPAMAAAPAPAAPQPWQNRPDPSAPQGNAAAPAGGMENGNQNAGGNFGNTVILGDGNFGENTVVIGTGTPVQVQKPHLIRCSTNEKIFLDKEIFRLGKERSYVDYCISGNSTVSRSHADILCRNGQVYIRDNNSTNHTYINGEMIPSNKEVLLSHGAKILLSNEEFEYRTF